jgi:shikimate kinase
MVKHNKKIDASQLQIKQPIVLVGLMGAGKTTIGRRLAQLLDIPFVDSDQEIVEAAGCSISDIFELYGEDVFRDLEKRVMKRLLNQGACVIATGGGAFIQPTIRENIQEKSISVWLNAELDVLVDRVSRRDTRPLLKTGDKQTIMKRLMEERYPIYAEAHLNIDSNVGPHEEVVDKIVDALAAQEKK